MNTRPKIINPVLLLALIMVGIGLGLPRAASAAIVFVARVDQTQVTVEEPLTYTLQISGDVGSLPTPTLPQLTDFNVYSSGRSQQYNLANGKMSSSVTFKYVMIPKKTGSLTIGSATVVIEGQVHRTSPITITVTGRAATPAARKPGAGQTSAAPASNKRRLFIEAALSEDTVYVNQSTTLTFRFYRGERLYGSPEYTPPSLVGFWKEDLPPQKKYYRTVSGVRYDVTEIQTALFPISAGKMNIDPFRLTAMVEQKSQNRRREPFGMFGDDFFSAFRRGTPHKMTSRPLKLTVLPLPAQGRPTDFSGLVGSFEITAIYDRTTVPVNEPITARLTIAGRGNIKSITEPQVTAPPDFRLYNAGATENVSKAGYRVSGAKTFEEVFVPRRAGTYELPVFSLSYFDPQKRQYITRHTAPVTVTVTPGETDFSLPPRPTEANEIAYLAKDIRFLKSDAATFRRNGSNGVYLWFVLLHVLPVSGLGVVVLVRRRKDRLESDVAYRRSRYAGRNARRQLAASRKLAQAGDAANFYPAISTALADYFGDLFNRSGRGLIRAEISATFAEHGVAEDHRDDFVSILDTCDQARFAPGAETSASMQKLYDRALNLLTVLDQGRGRGRRGGRAR